MGSTDRAKVSCTGPRTWPQLIPVDMTDPARVAEALTAKTRVVYLETPANPNMRLVDIAAVSALAHAQGLGLGIQLGAYCRVGAG